MSWELYYTSANRGLRPHSSGFCTVARTDGMSAAVVERLESLSSYQPIHPGGARRLPIAIPWHGRIGRSRWDHGSEVCCRAWHL